jgi:predicted O-methyltransferase YrrM
MKSLLRVLKQVWILNFIRRIYQASKYYNYKYLQILKWGIASREDTNYTYHLTSDNLICLAQTIALVTNKDYQTIIQYINELENNKELEKYLLEATQNSDERKFADKEARYGRRVGWYALARAIKPKTIIETGVDKGLGSVVLCAALEKNALEGYQGRYYGTDINPKAGYLLNGKYKAFGEILYGDSIASLSQFKDTIDLFINDSDHSVNYEFNEYKTIQHLLNPQSIILGDNSHFSNSLSRFSLENNRHFLFFQEKPKNHWYPGCGIGISFLK